MKYIITYNETNKIGKLLHDLIGITFYNDVEKIPTVIVNGFEENEELTFFPVVMNNEIILFTDVNNDKNLFDKIRKTLFVGQDNEFWKRINAESVAVCDNHKLNAKKGTKDTTDKVKKLIETRQDIKEVCLRDIFVIREEKSLPTTFFNIELDVDKDWKEKIDTNNLLQIKIGVQDFQERYKENPMIISKVIGPVLGAIDLLMDKKDIDWVRGIDVINEKNEERLEELKNKKEAK